MYICIICIYAQIYTRNTHTHTYTHTNTNTHTHTTWYSRETGRCSTSAFTVSTAKRQNFLLQKVLVCEREREREKVKKAVLTNSSELNMIFERPMPWKSWLMVKSGARSVWQTVEKKDIVWQTVEKKEGISCGLPVDSSILRLFLKIMEYRSLSLSLSLS